MQKGYNSTESQAPLEVTIPAELPGHSPHFTPRFLGNLILTDEKPLPNLSAS